MPLQVLLDEHISPNIAHRLTDLGVYVTCARDRGLANRGLRDGVIMDYCVARQLTVCTKNRKDFEEEHQRLQSTGQSHSGILVVGDWTPEEIYWTLRQYLESNPDPALVTDHIEYLPKAAPEFIQDRSPE